MQVRQTISSLLFISTLLVGCSEGREKPKPPKVLLEQKEMEKILIEIHLSDAIAQEKSNGNLDMEKNLTEQGMKQILQNYRLSKKDFDSLYAFYIQQPELMNIMYQNIIADLSKKQAELAH